MGSSICYLLLFLLFFTFLFKVIDMGQLRVHHRSKEHISKQVHHVSVV